MLNRLKNITVALTLSAAFFASSANAAEMKDMSWEQIVAQAKEEGSLNWYQWYFKPEFREQVKAFEAEYGIKVTIPEGGGGENRDKLLAERNRDAGDIDVLSIWTGAFTEFDPEGLLYQYGSVIPNGSKANMMPENTDTKGYAVAFWGNQSGLAYNSTRIEEADLPQSAEEVSAWAAANSKAFGYNVEKGGSGKGFLTSVSRHLVKDVNFDDKDDSAEKLAKLKPAYDWFAERSDNFTVTASNADTATRINDGELIIGASYEDFIAGLQRKGEISKDIKFYIPKFGMPGGNNIVTIPENAPNKAAAVVFVNWLISAETQTGFNKNFGAVPQNADSSDEFALVPADQRAYAITWPAEPFQTKFMDGYIENVIQK